jgi:SRSO17 transposase
MEAQQAMSLRPQFEALARVLRPCFGRQATFDYMLHYTLGLLTDLPRKSVEPIALAAGIPVRNLQEFLAYFKWDHQRCVNILQRRVADQPGRGMKLGVIDASGYPKSGPKTPGVQRQYCGQSGKIDNCVVGQHLLYTDNDPVNPLSCMLESDLYLPESWAQDQARREEAGIPDELPFRPKWMIAVHQLERALSNGIRFDWVTFDEDYGSVPEFWFDLDLRGVRGIGEVRSNFKAWVKPPACRSLRAEHAPRDVANLCTHSPLFTSQPWQLKTIKQTTRGPCLWRVKAGRVHLSDAGYEPSQPTDRQYWLIVAQCVQTDEVKYFVSNAGADADLDEMLRAAWGRWHVEKWFERAKQETGLGAFEVRTYTGLLRHWFCSQLAMLFLAQAALRLRGEKSGDHAGTDRDDRRDAGGEALAAGAEQLVGPAGVL